MLSLLLCSWAAVHAADTRVTSLCRSIHTVNIACHRTKRWSVQFCDTEWSGGLSDAGAPGDHAENDGSASHGRAHSLYEAGRSGHRVWHLSAGAIHRFPSRQSGPAHFHLPLCTASALRQAVVQCHLHGRHARCCYPGALQRNTKSRPDFLHCHSCRCLRSPFSKWHMQ